MLDQPAAMHVARIRSSHTDKQGREREYESRLLRQGEVAESGPVEQILDHPADPYTQRLVEDVPKLGQSKPMARRAREP
jgi:ABC-type glutathione transport system ATPase component